MTNQLRLYNLDYLRGLAAFGIMIYHYLTWALGTFSANTFVGRIGIYGVSIFYVLSGLTLFFVYYDKMNFSRQEIFVFFKKRIFRIFPLLWFVTIIGILLSRKTPDFFDLFLNLTGLFGFVKWNVYFSAGIWSIGNELVFYTFFPCFVLFAKSNRLLLAGLSVVLLLFYLYFAFGKLDPALTLSEQWRDYVNPLNQVFLFLGGFLIGLLFNKSKVNNIVIITLLLIGLLLFILHPTQGSAISLVTGANRLIFTFCCFLICFSFYKLSFRLPSIIHNPLTLLGEASYSIYLLHPIIYTFVGLFLSQYFPAYKLSQIFLSIFLTLCVSYFTYEYFEKYFMRLGKRV